VLALAEPAEVVAQVDSSAARDYLDPRVADFVSASVAAVGAAVLVVAAAAAAVQPVAGAAFVSAADFVVVTGPVLWVMSRLVYAGYLQ